jgi:hypothetical protein
LIKSTHLSILSLALILFTLKLPTISLYLLTVTSVVLAILDDESQLILRKQYSPTAESNAFPDSEPVLNNSHTLLQTKSVSSFSTATVNGNRNYPKINFYKDSKLRRKLNVNFIYFKSLTKKLKIATELYKKLF